MVRPLELFLQQENQNLRDAGLFKAELPIESAHKAVVSAHDRELVNLASANYLGFSDHVTLKRSGKGGIDHSGVGVASGRMLSGSQTAHRELEERIAKFLGKEDALLFQSGYHAHTGLFESLFGLRDYLFLDGMCHPSLADGVRLSQAHAHAYRSGDMKDLEDRLKRSSAARFRVIVTDGVMPVDGELAPLREVCGLATRYDAHVVLNDSEGIGVLGPNGRGSGEHFAVLNQISMVTGSFNYALGGAGGGFVAGSHDLIAWLRQKSRPYLMSSALSPYAVLIASEALKLVDKEARLRARLLENVKALKSRLEEGGLTVRGGEHAILSVVVGDAVRAQQIITALYEAGIYAVGHCHPIVAEGDARVRFQVSAKHTKSALDRTVTTMLEACAKYSL